MFIILLAGGYYFFWIYPQYSVPILMYHSFGKASQRDLLSVSSEHFEMQMSYLKKNRYHVISFDEFVDGFKTGKKFPHNTVVITIDDGYQNNYTIAYPILKKYNFPATIFLITNLMDKNDAFLTWDEIREMLKNGITFGGHTKSHFYLPAVDNKNTLWDEIMGSKKMIEDHIGAPVKYFAYPFGGFTDEIEKFVEEAGYRAATATNRGYDILNQRNLYELDRVSVRNWKAGGTFQNAVSGYYYVFKKGKRGN